MKIIILDWIYGMGRTWKKIIVSIIAFSLFFLLLGNLLLYMPDEKSDPYVQNKKGKYIYCSLYRTSASSSNYRIKERPFLIEGMKGTLIKLRESENFEYMAIDEESYAVIDMDCITKHFKKDEYLDFLAGSLYQGYYNKNPQEIEKLKTENGKEARRFLACKMDANAMNHYALEVSQGKLFDTEDYILDMKEKKIAVILGSNYERYFKVGDIIKMYFLGIDVEAKVIGILKPGMLIKNDKTYEQLGDEPNTLDFSIIIPYFGIKGAASNIDDINFITVQYLNQLSGTMIFDNKVTKKEIYNELRRINDYYLESNIFTVNSSITKSGFFFFQGEYSQSMRIISVLIILLLTICIFNIYLSMLNSIKSKTYIYAIQIMNGKSWRSIIIENVAEVFIIFVISLLFVFAVNTHWFYQNALFYIKYFLIIIGVLLVIEILLIKHLSKMDIDQMMRRNIE